jgi:hypothetical protein
MVNDWDLGDEEGEENDAVPLTVTTTKTDKQFNPRDLLAKAAEVDFNNSAEANKFAYIYGGFLSMEEAKSVNGNVLHELADLGEAEETTAKDKNPWTRPKVKEFVHWILANPKYKHLFQTDKDVGGYTPLHNALYKKNHFFVERVLEEIPPDSPLLHRILHHATAKKETCLHLAIIHDSKHTERLIEICIQMVNATRPVLPPDQDWTAVQDPEKPEKATVFGQVDNSGGTPLHYATRLRETDSYEVKPLYEANEDDPENKSLENISKPGPTAGHRQQEAAIPNGFAHTPPQSPRTPLPGKAIDEEISPRKVPEITVSTPVPDQRQLEIVRRLVEADWTALKSATQKPEKEGEESLFTPFQAREDDIRQRLKAQLKSKFLGDYLSQLPKPERKATRTLLGTKLKQLFEELRGTDNILSAIRSYCFEKFEKFLWSRRTIMQCLYPSGSGNTDHESSG